MQTSGLLLEKFKPLKSSGNKKHAESSRSWELREAEPHLDGQAQ